MENYLLFRILHGLATLLFFGGLAGLSWYGWRNFRSGDAARIASSLRRILLIGVPQLPELLARSGIAVPRLYRFGLVAITVSWIFCICSGVPSPLM